MLPARMWIIVLQGQHRPREYCWFQWYITSPHPSDLYRIIYITNAVFGRSPVTIISAIQGGFEDILALSTIIAQCLSWSDNGELYGSRPCMFDITHYYINTCCDKSLFCCVQVTWWSRHIIGGLERCHPSARNRIFITSWISNILLARSRESGWDHTLRGQTALRCHWLEYRSFRDNFCRTFTRFSQALRPIHTSLPTANSSNSDHKKDEHETPKISACYFANNISSWGILCGWHLI